MNIMDIQVTSPSVNRQANTAKLLHQVIIDLEDQFKTEPSNQETFHLVIRGEYPRNVLDKVEEIYKNAGWIKVICKTSSENGERPGLTGLMITQPDTQSEHQTNDKLDKILTDIAKRKSEGHTDLYLQDFRPTKLNVKILQDRKYKVEIGGRYNEVNTYIKW